MNNKDIPITRKIISILGVLLQEGGTETKYISYYTMPFYMKQAFYFILSICYSVCIYYN